MVDQGGAGVLVLASRSLLGAAKWFGEIEMELEITACVGHIFGVCCTYSHNKCNEFID
jgi:hypothetical protein